MIDGKSGVGEAVTADEPMGRRAAEQGGAEVALSG